MSITTIKLTTETKNRLNKLKEHSRETYEETLRKILFILNLTKTQPERAQRRLKKLDKLNKLASKKYNGKL